MNSEIKTASILIIGNEILSGRTKDANLGWLAEQLTALNIQVREVRVVPDIEAEIINAVNHLRERYDYVFTTGGIGPTHDDITADSIAKAFKVGIEHHPEAIRRLKEHYKSGNPPLNEARLRMARIPVGAALIDNPSSAAPGFRLENVYVMAGVPKIMQAMFAGFKHELTGGAPLYSEAVTMFKREGDIADALTKIQNDNPDVEIGSYPFFQDGKVGTSLVVRGIDKSVILKVTAELGELSK